MKTDIPNNPKLPIRLKVKMLPFGLKIVYFSWFDFVIKQRNGEFDFLDFEVHLENRTDAKKVMKAL